MSCWKFFMVGILGNYCGGIMMVLGCDLKVFVKIQQNGKMNSMVNKSKIIVEIIVKVVIGFFCVDCIVVFFF